MQLQGGPKITSLSTYIAAPKVAWSQYPLDGVTPVELPLLWERNISALRRRMDAAWASISKFIANR